MLRNQLGQFVSAPMEDELKARISLGQQERHRRDRARQGPRPELKRCTQCKQMRRVPDDYYMRRRVLRSGEVVYQPPGECKHCSRERADAWKEALGEEEAKRRQAAYNRRRHEKDPEDHRRKQREWSRAARERQGVVARGPWKRYREVPTVDLRDPTYFLEWLSRHPVSLTENEARRIRNVRGPDGQARPGKLLSLRTIDAVMTRGDAVHLFRIGYPPKEDSSAAI